MKPHFVDEDGRLKMSIHALVVETPSRTIIVDTSLGNDKDGRAVPGWNKLQLPFLRDLAAAGFAREKIDTVMCTHLHVDHVGWNTMLVDGKWLPTFPKARYLTGRAEFEYWQEQREHAEQAAVFSDSVKPDGRAHAGSCQHPHFLQGRRGTHHRRLHPPSLSDGAAGLGGGGRLREDAVDEDEA